MKNQNTSKKTNTKENIMEMVPEQPQTRSVKEVLAEDAIMLKGMNFTMDEARKFFPIFAKLEEDLVACVEAIEKEEQKQKEAQQNAAADPE